MTQSMDRLDRLVEDYLGAVSYACRDLPPDQRDDLVVDLREHISAARAVLYQPTEAAVRTILDRLGEPTAIAEEARLSDPFGPATAVQAPARTPVRLASREHWIQRPLSPAMFAMLAFALIITVLVLGTVIVMSAR
jgi:uncharacterized membrane protein